jgi:two-component system, NarL family, nitrate/nitrite response regulator NarL
MKREPVGTVLVGPSALLREGLARILAAAGFRILASACGVDQPVLSSFSQEQSILLIIDVGDHAAAALRQIKSFKQWCPAGRVAVLAHQQKLTDVVSAFRAGANAYLDKVVACDTLIKSLKLVMLGVTLLPPEVLAFISHGQDPGRESRAVGSNGNGADDEDDPDDGHVQDDDDDGGDDGEIVSSGVETNEHVQPAKPLSARQQSILRLLIEGDSNKTIARKMAISDGTVKVHVKAILRKIRVHNRTQAAVWAMNTDPLMSAKDGALPPVLEKPRVEPFPSVDVAQVVPAWGENGSVCLPTLEGTNHVVLSNIFRLVSKDIRRKNDRSG